VLESFVTKLIVDVDVNRGELLQGLHSSQPQRCPRRNGR
jgi:hypothetical protein